MDSRHTTIEIPTDEKYKSTRVLKIDVLQKHKWSVDHKQEILMETMVAQTAPLDQVVSKAQNDAEDGIISAMNIIYLQAKENLATRKFSILKELCIDLGCSKLQVLNADSHTNYEGYDSLRNMEYCIASVIREDLLDKLQSCAWFGVMIDESTDVSVEQSMIVCLKIPHKSGVSTHFLSLEALPDDIYECLMQTLEKYNIDLSKLGSIATDGASVMMGTRKGVTALLKNQCPHVISIHCVAHRLALATGQAADHIPYLVKFQDILNRVYKYFQNSAKNVRALKEIQQLLDVPEKKFVQTFAARWLSLGTSVISSCFANWKVLVSVLLEDKRPIAQGLLKNVTSHKFLAVTAMMQDIMFTVNKLCCCFQKKSIDFELVQNCVDVCLQSLKEMKTTKGPHYAQFCESVPPANESQEQQYEFEGHSVMDSIKQRQEVDNIYDQYLSILIENVEGRLGDLEQVKIFNIFSSLNLPNTGSKHQDEELLKNYGQAEIQAMCNLFENTVYGNTFARTAVLSEWNLFKKLLQCRCKNMTFDETFSFIQVNKLTEDYLLITSLMEFAAAIPLHTADYERGFSLLNIIKTDLRNRLQIANVSTLMTINIEGPARKKFNFKKAFRLWSSKRKRRVLS